MSAVPPPMTPSANRKGPSCLFGCLALAGFFAIVLVIGGVAVYFSFKSLLDAYTDTEPAQLPQVTLTDEEQNALQEKVDALLATLAYENDQSVYLFTGKELNALIGMFPETQWLEDAVHINVAGSRVFGDVSFPLSRFGFPGDRYINGQATFEVGLYRGELAVYVKELSVKGKPVSEDFMEGFGSQNLAEGLNQDIEFSNMLSRIESVNVSDSRVSVKLMD